MILYELEGKKLLQEAGLPVPKSIIVDTNSLELLQKNDFQVLKQVLPGALEVLKDKGVVLKAQVLSGKRADVGGILVVGDLENAKSQILNMFGKSIKGEKVAQVLIEEKIDVAKEFYVSIAYDSDYRSPILSISESGGTGIEERGVKVYPIDILETEKVLKQVQDDGITMSDEILKKLIKCFFEQDCLLLEVNPLVLTKSGEWMVLDAKIKLDDDAAKRHEDWKFPPRLVPGHTPTQREIDAKKFDENDYRGTAGSAYMDLDGDIAVLSSGGGISLTAMDALIGDKGKPANFTEYSGNPPKEKVVKLTKIVLNKPNIHGLWVIGTVAANFTDIYETLSGLIEGLREAQKELQNVFDYPIVIRRGGPRDDEAFAMLREVKDFNLILQGEESSISESSKVMVRLAGEYKSSSRDSLEQYSSRRGDEK
jgi:citryl-CoA synthetase large subunit